MPGRVIEAETRKYEHAKAAAAKRAEAARTPGAPQKVRRPR